MTHYFTHLIYLTVEMRKYIPASSPEDANIEPGMHMSILYNKISNIFV